MKAVERIRAKLSSWAAACRGFWSAESMVVVDGKFRASRLREVVGARTGERYFGSRCSEYFVRKVSWWEEEWAKEGRLPVENCREQVACWLLAELWTLSR